MSSTTVQLTGWQAYKRGALMACIISHEAVYVVADLGDRASQGPSTPKLSGEPWVQRRWRTGATGPRRLAT